MMKRSYRTAAILFIYCSVNNFNYHYMMAVAWILNTNLVEVPDKPLRTTPLIALRWKKDSNHQNWEYRRLVLHSRNYLQHSMNLYQVENFNDAGILEFPRAYVCLLLLSLTCHCASYYCLHVLLLKFCSLLTSSLYLYGWTCWGLPTYIDPQVYDP